MSESDGSSRLPSETVDEKANNRTQRTEIGSQSTEEKLLKLALRSTQSTPVSFDEINIPWSTPSRNDCRQ